jgi:hypothetical protein
MSSEGVSRTPGVPFSPPFSQGTRISAVVDPVDYELVLRYPDRGEPDHSDFTSFEGEVEPGQVLILPEKGEWRVESIEQTPDLRLPRLVCVPA